MTLAPEQLRAARAWLNWSQEELATRANVSLSTVRDFENGKRNPMKNNLGALRRTIEEAGIELLWAGSEPFGIGLSKTGPLARPGSLVEG